MELVYLLLFITGQNYFYQNHCLEETFSCHNITRPTLLFEILKLSFLATPWTQKISTKRSLCQIDWTCVLLFSKILMYIQGKIRIEMTFGGFSCTCLVQSSMFSSLNLVTISIFFVYHMLCCLIFLLLFTNLSNTLLHSAAFFKFHFA